MKLKGILLTAVFIACIVPAWAQQKYTVSGRVKDAKTGEELIGVVVMAKGENAGVTTNTYGFYSLTLDAGKHTLSVNYLGYETLLREVNLTKDVQLNLELKPTDIEIEEVVVTGKKADENVKEISMSKVNVDITTIKRMPMLMGEADVIKGIQMMPGVQTAGEGGSGFYVRGGGVDQNLILIDEAPVYNASHLLGFFSVFNSDAVKNVELYKGGIPAAYGGRLSSILDVNMKEGNSKQFSASGGIGLISSRLTLEGPIVKDKSAFIVSGRRTYADVFLKFAPDEALRENTLYFYDLSAKVNYEIGKKDRLFLSGYFGKDRFGFGDFFGMGWGNTTATLRWNHIYGNKLFSNVTAIFSKYDYRLDISQGEQSFKWLSDVEDKSLKADFTYYPNPKNTIRFGAIGTYHIFNPGELKPEGESFFNNFKLETKYAFEEGIYISNDQTISDRLSAQYGLRYSLFQNVGPGTIYTYDAQYDVNDTTVYDDLETIKNYGGLEPRAALRYTINTKSSVKASYNRMYQYLSLLSNTNSTNASDIWVPASPTLAPQRADQVALGYFRNLLNNQLETSVEVYYKWMDNQVDFKDNARLFLNPTVENQLRFGSGEAYGVEFFVRKQVGKLTGWVSYTLSKTTREINGVNNGKPYPPRYDRRHNIAIVGSYDISKRVNISANWVYNTGAAVSMPVGRYEYQGYVIPFYTERNGYRLPAYHRMDLSVNLYPKQKEGRKFESFWNFSIYNVYNRYNTYSINFREDVDNPGNTQAVQLSLFGIIPSVTWNFKF